MAALSLSLQPALLVDSDHDTPEYNDAASQRVAYIGIPGEPVYRFRTGVDSSRGSLLNPRHDLSMLGSIGEDRCDDDGCRCQLAVAILGDFLGDSARILRIYHAFARVARPRTPIFDLWLMNESDVAALIDKAEHQAGLTWDEETGTYHETSSTVFARSSDTDAEQ